MNRQRVNEILDLNSIHHPKNEPLIVVFRNTDLVGNLIEDNGTNNCDSILCMDPSGREFLVKGRSIPHNKYQQRMVEGTDRANQIASSYTRYAWRKGFHRGFPALQQYVKFSVIRSKDMQWGNADDYGETGIQADNFHGWAPGSAGCVTIEGDMGNPYTNSTGDWLEAVSWIYESSFTFYSALILEHSDVTNENYRLRLGSTGERVKTLQLQLGIRPDGDFGPITYMSLFQYQKDNGWTPTGIYQE